MKTYSTKATAKRALKNALAKINLTLEDVHYDIFAADVVDMGNGFVNRVEFATESSVPHGVETLEEVSLVVRPEPKPHQSKSGYIRGVSTCIRPCDMVHAIADAMKAENPNTTRKEILQACYKAGVTYGTARTQYQKWRENN